MTQAFIIWLVVGGIAGWLASMIMKGGPRLTGNTIVDNVITGVVGAVVGGWLLNYLKIPLGGDIVGSIISALIGAVVVIFGLGLVMRR